MNDIVLPLYLAMACLFVGLTLAGMPARDSRLMPDERMGLYGVMGGVAAALACACIALAPLLGRALLVELVGLFLLVSDRHLLDDHALEPVSVGTDQHQREGGHHKQTHRKSQ